MTTKRKNPAVDADTRALLAAHQQRSADPAYQARLEAVRAASRVLGTTHEARLRWVLGFMAEDPSTWQPGVRQARADCLFALGRPDVCDISQPLPPDRLEDVFEPGDVETMHKELRATLRALLGMNPTRAQFVTIPTEDLSQELVRMTPAGKKPAMFAVSYGSKNPRTAIFQTVKDLVLQAGDRLIACLAPGCGNPFIANRKQEYCTSQCAQRVRNQRRGDPRPRKTDRRKRAK